jgi:hypothetical protein
LPDSRTAALGDLGAVAQEIRPRVPGEQPGPVVGARVIIRCKAVEVTEALTAATENR